MQGLGSTKRSDTKEFVEDYLDKLPFGFWHDEQCKMLLDRAARFSSSKFVLLTPEKNVQIYNANAGEYDKGRWFSNTSYKYARVRTRRTKKAQPDWYAGYKADKPDQQITNVTAIVKRDEEKVCLLCGMGTWEELYTIPNLREKRYLCQDCFGYMVQACNIECQACGVYTPLTEELIHGGMACTTCGVEIPSSDVVWQLERLAT